MGAGPPPLDLGDPRWFLGGLDFNAGLARFVRTERETLAGEPFLDPRWRRDGPPRAAMAFAELERRAGARPELRFIWHTSLCASTLIASLLDTPDKVLALKEPQALTAFAAARRAGLPSARPELLAGALTMLARPFAPGEALLIKPSNFANPAARLCASLSKGRSVVLTAPCRSFLLAVARRGEAGGAYARELLTALRAHDPGLPGADALPPLEAAALAWAAQVRQLGQLLDEVGGGAASLDGERFAAEPAAGLRALSGFFGLSLDEAAIAERTAAPALARDAKRAGETHDAAGRRAEDAELAAALHDELDRAMALAAGRGVDLDARLPRPLL